MRKISLFILIFALHASAARATVYEYNTDGTVLKHEAFDYQSENGLEQFDLVMPAIMQTGSPFLLTGGNYDAAILQASQNYGLNAALIKAVIHTESAGKYNAVSSKGAQGLMQLMPATAKQYGVTDPFDPQQNIAGGAKYLSYLLTRYDGDTKLALAAYNAGEGAVDKYKGIPPYPETISYVQKIYNSIK